MFPAPTGQAFERLGWSFLAEFLEIACRRRPRDIDTLAELGGVYTRLGRYREGLEIDRLLASLAPDNPTVRYNLACSLALCGDATPAIEQLERAISLGYDDAEHMLADDDLATLRELPAFQALVERLREHH